MKITKNQLQNMFSMANDNFVNLAPTELINGQNFTAKCWLLAAANILGVKEEIEFEQMPNVSPAEEGY